MLEVKVAHLCPPWQCYSNYLTKPFSRSISAPKFKHMHEFLTRGLCWISFAGYYHPLKSPHWTRCFIVQRVTIRYAWLMRALERSRKKTFLPAVRHSREWRQLPTPVQKVVHRNSRLIKKIYEKWDTIVHNVTQQSMIYVDVRRFSLYQLSRSCSFTWVKQYNKNHAPKDTRRPDKIYTYQMVVDIVHNVAGAIERVLDAVDGDEDQVKMIGKDITNLLLLKADQRLNIQ